MRGRERVRAALLAAACGAVLAPSVASSASAGTGGFTYKFAYNTVASPTDAGGVDARIRMLTPSGRLDYSALFLAHDEILQIRDNYSDGARALVTVRIYSPGGQLKYADAHYCPNTCNIELGVPGSKGNVPEGYRVSFILSRESGPASKVISGVA